MNGNTSRQWVDVARRIDGEYGWHVGREGGLLKDLRGERDTTTL